MDKIDGDDSGGGDDDDDDVNGSNGVVTLSINQKKKVY